MSFYIQLDMTLDNILYIPKLYIKNLVKKNFAGIGQ